MEISFSDLRSKEVVNTQDGRKLGKVCDVVLCYPENRWLGIVVPGTHGFMRKKNELFIDLKSIVKIGEDVILVNVGFARVSKDSKHGHGASISSQNGVYDYHMQPRERSFEEFE